MKNKRLFFIVFAVLLLIIVGVFIYQFLNKPVTLTSTPIKINEPVIRYNDSSVLFSNERAFVAYNYTDGSVKTLGKEHQLPKAIRNLSLSKDLRFIMFVAQKQFFNDTLGQELMKKGVSTNQPIWWVYDTQDDVFSFLPPKDIISATFSNSDNAQEIIALSRTIAEETDNVYDSQIQTFSLPKVEKTRAIDSSYYVDIKTGQPGKLFVYSTERDVSLLDAKSGEPVESFNEISAYSPSSSQPYFLNKYIDNEEESIQLINIETKKTETLTKGVYGHDLGGVWSINGEVVYYPKANKTIGVFDVTGKKTTDYTVNGLGDTSGDFSVVAHLATDSLMVRNSDEIYFATKATSFTPKNPTGYKSKTQNNTLIEYNNNENVFFATVETDNQITQEEKQIVYDKLSSDGFSPSFWTIRFSNTGY